MNEKDLIKEINDSRIKCLQGKTREDISDYFRGLVDGYTHILRFLGE